MKSKSVTTQMKALDEYILMVVFTLFLNRIYVCLYVCMYVCMFYRLLCFIWTESVAVEGLNVTL